VTHGSTAKVQLLLQFSVLQATYLGRTSAANFCMGVMWHEYTPHALGRLKGIKAHAHAEQWWSLRTLQMRCTLMLSRQGRRLPALDWNDGSPVGPLACHSYQLHKALADVFGRDAIGYREVETVQVCAAATLESADRGWAACPATRLPAFLTGSCSDDQAALQEPHGRC